MIILVLIFSSHFNHLDENSILFQNERLNPEALYLSLVRVFRAKLKPKRATKESKMIILNFIIFLRYHCFLLLWQSCVILRLNRQITLKHVTNNGYTSRIGQSKHPKLEKIGSSEPFLSKNDHFGVLFQLLL